MGSISKSPPPSALSTFLTTHPAPPQSPSSREHHALALQIAHNLRYQHSWTDIRIHHPSPSSPPGPSSSSSIPPPSLPAAPPPSEKPSNPAPRPLLSGLPPRRLYIHPDEQIAHLQAQVDAEREGKPIAGSGSGGASEREWVLPSHIREKWSLRGFGEVFDGVAKVPSGKPTIGPSEGVERRWGEGEELFGDGGENGGGREGDGEDGEEENTWRTAQPKRLVLATVDDDSTVVYYIVHDGIVKPRQN